MHISRIKLNSFAGFEQTEWIELSSAINAVSGRNNSGKSSLLQAMSLSTPNNPHKDPERFAPGQRIPQRIYVEAKFDREELLHLVASNPGQINIVIGGISLGVQNQFLKELKSSDEFVLQCFLEMSGFHQTEPTFAAGNSETPHTHTLNMEGGELKFRSLGAGRDENLLEAFLDPNVGRKMFYLPAERYHVSKVNLGRHERLSGDTRNLAGFLQFLQGNSARKFEQIQRNLRSVVPSVERITIDTLTDGFEILIWPDGAADNRQLALTLNECGTGISQILAIFAIVSTHNKSIIIVDEINSFLHPQAVKDLLSILASEYADNQYIISTHSSDVLSHPSVDRIINVQKTKFKSSVSDFDKTNITALKDSMRGLGISMSDVLGADNFLWVEGPTEEVAFPNLIREHIGDFPKGLHIVPVNATGDFESKGRDKRTTIRIYDHVRKAAAPLSTGMSFLLDREGMTETSMNDLVRQTDDKLKVIPRRCIENYVLDPEIIFEVIKEDLGSGLRMDLPEFTNEMVKLAESDGLKNRTKFSGNFDDDSWLIEVDGAKLLARLFEQTTQSRLEFRKTHHTPRLLSKAKPDNLSSLINALRERLVKLGYFT